jgi:hypothetical protein
MFTSLDDCIEIASPAPRRPAGRAVAEMIASQKKVKAGWLCCNDCERVIRPLIGLETGREHAVCEACA